MNPESYHPEEPIVALATPWLESALALLRVSGSDCLKRLDRLFRGKREPSTTPGHRLLHGFIQLPGEEEPIDEVTLAVYRSPRSYTGEDSAEICCHGSPVVVRRILSALHGLGFIDAGPGEFTLRAFLNHRMGLTQAEAVNEIVRARTDRARAAALNRLSGSVEGEVRGIRDAVLGMLAAVEVRIDYPEEDLEEGIVGTPELERGLQALDRLIGSFAVGRILQEGVTVALAGRTNSGKSTLFNRLLREDRAIVSEIHGTTRDYLEASVSLGEVPVRLFDTAGLRDSEHPLELEGIRRTEAVVRNADFTIYLVDAGLGLEDPDRLFLSSFPDPARLVTVWNKTDLLRGPGTAGGRVAPPPDGFIPLSARNGEGIESLVAAVREKALGGAVMEAGTPVLSSLRQKELLEEAREALQAFRAGLDGDLPLDLLAVDLKEALDALGRISGEIASPELLQAIFSRFCVGK